MQIFTEKDHKARIDMVIDFILKDLNDSISLEALAEVANYSPFHLQKIFKKIMGESPKQYIMKLRLENALHLMIIHQHKSIQEIAMDCGFSSPAVFSRSVKNFYGLSPEKFRTLSMKERIDYLKVKNPEYEQKNNAEQHLFLQEEYVAIEVKKIETITGFYLIAPFDDPHKIREMFRELQNLVNSHDFDLSKIYGVVSPHQGNIYKTFIAVDNVEKAPKKFKITEIKSGKYAVFSVKGKKEKTLKAAHYFFQRWLPESGYKIADIVGFESFSGNPAVMDYQEIERKIHVRIETV